MRNFGFATVALILFAANAQAVTVDFDGLVGFSGDSLDTDGFTFFGSPSGSFPNSLAVGVGVFGPSEVLVWVSQTTLSVSSTSGLDFALNSFDLGFGNTNIIDPTDESMEIIGFLSGGGTVSMKVLFPLAIQGSIIPVVFDNQWAGLSRVDIVFNDVGAFGGGLDNVDLTPVPLPAGIVLFLSALAGCLGLRIFRKPVSNSGF